MTAADRSQGAGARVSDRGALGILAGDGALPVQVAEAATASGRQVFVCALEGTFDERLRAFDLRVLKWGQIGSLEHLAKERGVTEVTLAGAINKRPDFRSLSVDFATMRLVPKLVKALVGGDDTVMGMVAKLIEGMGFRVVGPHEVAPALVAARGPVAGPAMHGAAAADAELAMKAAKTNGTLDIGQAAVAVGGRVVAVEAAEGTDAMIDRVGVLHATGRVKWKGRAGVVVKCAKPQQDLRLDMPAMGARTVEAVARAGLAGIAIEAGKVMIVDRAATVETAEKTGTFVVALDAP